MDPIELYEEETEGWPYDGSRTSFTFEAPGFCLTRTRRHIDADRERSEVERMDAAAGLAWLRARGIEAEGLDEVLDALGDALELVATLEGDAPAELRRAGEVWLLARLEPRWPELADAEDHGEGDAPKGLLGRAVAGISDRLHAWSLGVDADVLNAESTDVDETVRKWAWLDAPQVREHLRAAGWSVSQIDAALG